MNETEISESLMTATSKKDQELKRAYLFGYLTHMLNVNFITHEDYKRLRDYILYVKLPDQKGTIHNPPKNLL